MSSYNENLHATVVASLKEQEQDEKLLLSSLDASIITLYYAEGARITAAENLDLAVEKWKDQSALLEQAENNSNISINLLMSANQQKAYTGQSVTNTAVCASNIQIASNAIVRLAADLGGVFAILSAADFGSDIYDQSKLIREYINETAYAAKNVALSAMDSSKLIAEVSSPAIVDAAKLTNDSIASLCRIISSDADAMNATVITDDATFSAANSIEKVAQGKLETINVEYFATQNAHYISNRELNIDLLISGVTSNSFEVFFDPLVNPFEGTNLIVNNYKIIVVKDAAKSVFSIINAENLVLANELVPPQSILVPALDKKMSKVIFIDTLKDSDNDDIVLGTDYVVFVYALMLEPYKKSINNFDDYLSASSKPFVLTNTLLSPLSTTILVTSNDVGQQLNFNLPLANPAEIEYRCMFLPYSLNLTKGLLTENMLRAQLTEIKRLEEISDSYEPKYTYLQSELDNLKTMNDTLLLDNNINKDDLFKRTKNNNDDISKAQKSLKSLQIREQEEIQSLLAPQNPSPGFFFNLNLAERVSPANYEGVQTGLVIINADSTDNFGNFLIGGNSYVPVILTVSTEPEENQVQFTNALSDFINTPPFVYSAKI